MSEKHDWTYDEDYICCWRYLDFVFDNVGNDSMNSLVDIIVETLPDIKRESLKMKVQNIKQVALDEGLEDRLEISPLKNYSKQCKNAFDSAVDKYMKAKRSENYIKDQQILQEEFLKYQRREKEEGGIISLSDDTDPFEKPCFQKWQNDQEKLKNLKMCRYKCDKIEDTSEIISIKDGLEELIKSKAGKDVIKVFAIYIG